MAWLQRCGNEIPKIKNSRANEVTPGIYQLQLGSYVMYTTHLHIYTLQMRLFERSDSGIWPRP